MVEKYEFSKYERARIIGARGLQISMDAPLLIDIDENELDSINYDPLKIAEKELDQNVLPISVNKPMPKRKEETLDNVKVEETKASDAQKEQAMKQEEKDIAEGGDMMKLADSGEESEVAEEATPKEESMKELE